MVKTEEHVRVHFDFNVSDFVNQDQFKAAVNETKFVMIQKLEVNDTGNTMKKVNTIDVDTSSNHIISESTLLVDNVDNTNGTNKDLNDPFVNEKSIKSTSELPKGKESKETTYINTNTLQAKVKVRNEKAEDCTLLKWFFVCRDFRILKDKDILAV